MCKPRLLSMRPEASTFPMGMLLDRDSARGVGAFGCEEDGNPPVLGTGDTQFDTEASDEC